MSDEDLSNVNTEWHLQPFELGVNGARLMAQTINRLLEWQRSTGDFGYTLFLYSRGQQEVMIFFFTDRQHSEMVRVLKELLRIQE